MVHVTTASVAIIMNLEHLEPRVRGGLHVQNLEHQLVIADHGVAHLLVGLQVPAEAALQHWGDLGAEGTKVPLDVLAIVLHSYLYLYCILYI
jgi:hypothetical protein